MAFTEKCGGLLSIENFQISETEICGLINMETTKNLMDFENGSCSQVVCYFEAISYILIVVFEIKWDPIIFEILGP
jgi:hypothetical protein